MRYKSAEETKYERTQNISYYFFMLGLEFVLLRKTGLSSACEAMRPEM